MLKALGNWNMIRGGRKPRECPVSWRGIRWAQSVTSTAELWAWKSWSCRWSIRCFYWESDVGVIQADVGERVMWRASPDVCVSNCEEWEWLWLGWNAPFKIWTIKIWRQHFVLRRRFIYTNISWNIEAKIDCNLSQSGADWHVPPWLLYII